MPPISESPPNTNPVQSAYESFARETPLVTRYCISAFVFSYVTSFVFDYTSALVNIPLYTVFRFEIYRIILAPFISENILTLIFACFAFSTYGKMIEFSKGSTVFGTLVLMIGLLSNLIFLSLCLLLSSIQNEMTWLILKSSGPFTIIPGLMAFECALAPSDSKRRLFMCEIPTLYYAAVLTMLWYLFSGDNFNLFLSMAVGYLYGFRRLKFLWPSLSRRKNWESAWLRNFTQRPGWVVGSNDDDDRWLPLHGSQPSSNSSNLPPSSSTATVMSKPAFPSTGGRKLGDGDASQRRTQKNSTRETAVAAAERRAAEAEALRSTPKGEP